MKGIILAGGSGTRLSPVTQVVCKQLLPIYNKPMAYYPLSVLMLAGIREILIISTPQDINKFRNLFGDGNSWGISIEYAIQEQPRGIAEAFIVGERFIGQSSVCLILGDNIFCGENFISYLRRAVDREDGATIFAYYVKDPQRFGIVEFDQNFAVVGVEEKPLAPKSNYAITGLYFYDNKVINIAKSIAPSPRGELEITEVNKVYLQQGKLYAEVLGRGFAWFDTGTHKSLLEASQFIETLEERQGLSIGCIEEVAYRRGYINAGQLKCLVDRLLPSQYGQYLQHIIKRDNL